MASTMDTEHFSPYRADGKLVSLGDFWEERDMDWPSYSMGLFVLLLEPNSR